MSYLTNRNRTTFGDALRDLAFDLAYFEIDPKHYGANSTFFKEARHQRSAAIGSCGY